MTAKRILKLLCLAPLAGLCADNQAAAPANDRTLLEAVAYPGKLTGLRDSGPLVVSQNVTTIEGLRIRNPNGPCVVIASGVRDVLIRNNEIGPCQDDGVRILPGAGNIRIDHNHIHDTTLILPGSKYQSTIDGNGVQAQDVAGLIVRMNYIQDVTSGLVAFGGRDIRFEYNYVLDVHGDHTRAYIPRIGGQMVQLAELSTGAGTQVICNVSEQTVRSSPEDHVNIYRTEATAQTPLLVAYNRLRGWGQYDNASNSNGGIVVGDGGGAYLHIRGNVLVNPGVYAIQVAGGSGHTLSSNKVLYDNYQQKNIWPQGARLARYDAACSGNSLTDNRIRVIDLLHPRPDGSVGGGQSIVIDGCTESTVSGNLLEENAGLPPSETLFSAELPECRISRPRIKVPIRMRQQTRSSPGAEPAGRRRLDRLVP